MPVEHLPPAPTPDEIVEVLERDACVIVDHLASAAQLDAIEREMAPWIDANNSGVDSFSGKHTKRTGALVARSPTSHALVAHPLALGATKQLLKHATSFHLHLTQIISMGPGESSQDIHRDQWAFDMFPFPKGTEVQCNTLWAMTDFTQENGATRVVPGSHRYDDRMKIPYEDTQPAEMERGSVLFYTGAVYHGGGTNRSDAVRHGLNITYAVSWLTQEENQFLSVSPDIARELPEDLLRLMGYARAAYALNYVDDLRDPIQAIRPDLGTLGLGEVDIREVEKLRSASFLKDTGS